MSKMMLVSTDTMRKVAKFIQAAMPVIKEAQEKDATLAKVATAVGDLMVRDGFLDSRVKQAKVLSYVKNSADLSAAIEKLASENKAVKALGTATKSAAPTTRSAYQVFEDRLLG